MKVRPQTSIELTTADKIFEVSSYIGIVTIWLLAGTNYSRLPETIPMHYSTAGQADDFGSKVTILILPLVATVLFTGITILNRFSYLFSFAATTKDKNAGIQYTSATRILRYLKLAVVLIFTLIVFKTIQTASGKSEGLGIWFLPFTLLFLFIPLLYYVITYCITAKQVL